MTNITTDTRGTSSRRVNLRLATPMRLARSLIATAILLAVLTVAPAAALADGVFTAHSNGNPNVDVDWSGACPNSPFPPRSLIARFFGVFNGGNARVVELRLFNNTDRQIDLVGGVRIRGNATIKDEYFEPLPPHGSVIKYPNVTLDSPNVTVHMNPSIGFTHPAGACGPTDLQVFP